MDIVRKVLHYVLMPVVKVLDVVIIILQKVSDLLKKV